jgi:hypothetical protein
MKQSFKLRNIPWLATYMIKLAIGAGANTVEEEVEAPAFSPRGRVFKPAETLRHMN